MISCAIPRIRKMKANCLPRRNSGIPDVPENRQKCLLHRPPHPPKKTTHTKRTMDKTMGEALRGDFAADAAASCFLRSSSGA